MQKALENAMKYELDKSHAQKASENALKSELEKSSAESIGKCNEI